MSKMFMDKEWGVELRSFMIFVENILSLSAEKICEGILQCFINLGSRYKVRLSELCHDFLSSFCCLAVPRNFVGETFCAVLQRISVTEKI